MAISSPRQAQSPNVEITRLAIKNNSSGLLLQKQVSGFTPDTAALEYVIIDQSIEQQTVNPRTIDFYSISFIEDMNEPFMSGSLILCDSNNIFDQLAITTDAIIQIKLRFFDTIRTGTDSESYTTIDIEKYFTIISITNLDNPISQDITRGSGSPNYLNIKFTSKEAINFNQNILALRRPNTAIPTTFLGPISVENSETANFTKRDGTVVSGNGDGTPDSNPTIVFKREEIPELDEDGNPKMDDEGKPIVNPILDEFENEQFKIETTWTLSKHSCFFNELISGFNQDKDSIDLKYQRKFYSHATDNEIWLKPEYFFYPSYRPSEIPSVTQLINYIKSYAVLKGEPKYVDFMFWEDLKGFHFKSIKKMVDDEKEKEQKNTPKTYYTPDSNPNNIEAIVSTKIICDIESADNLSNGSLTSEYIRIKPYWKSPFRNGISTSELFTKQLIKYDYKTDITKPIISDAIWSGSPTIPPFNANEILYADALGDFDTTNFRVSDNIYGFYDETTHNAKKTKIWDFWDSNIMGFTYSTIGITDYDSDNKGLKYKEDTEPAVRTEKEFWQSQFDFCELSAGPLFIINQIKKAVKESKDEYVRAKTINEKWKFYLENVCCERKIPSNFFALLVDAKKIYGGDGTTFATDAGGIYAYDWVEVEFWPRENAQYLLKEGEELIKFSEYESFPFVFVKPKGALQGHGPVNRKYDPKKDPQKPSYPKDTVYSTKDTRAYNLSELLNSSGITMSSAELQGFPQDLQTAIKECQVLLTSPGLSSPKDRTKIECKSSYPSGFSMLPAGGFRYQGNCSSADETFKTPLFFGKIVQMNVIPREIMQTIVKGEQGLTGITQTDSDRTGLSIDGVPFKQQTKEEKEQQENNIPYLFLFDSVNAHDGLCDNTCAI